MLRSNSPLLFNFRDHLFEKHLCHLHLVDAGNVIFFHCTGWTILAASSRNIFENERTGVNLAIEMTIGMAVSSRTSDITHEHNVRNVTLNFARSMWWCLTSNKVEVHIDLCHVEPLLIDMYILTHCVKMLVPRIHEGI